MTTIVITEFMDEEAVDSLRADFDVVYEPDLVDRVDDLKALVGTAKALIVRNRTQVTAEVLDAGPELVVVGRLGVGLDNIDLDACAARGVAVRPATGGNAIAVAEYVITAALMLRRGAYRAHDQMLQGKWPRAELAGHEVAGTRLGLVGYGRIAQEVAVRAWAMRMTVAAFDPYVDPGSFGRATRLPLDDVFASSDVVSLHVPLTDETTRLVDADRIASMRPGAVLINTARGGIVDEVALVDALRSGRLGGAALDTFEHEPLGPVAAARFHRVPNLLITPHIAGVTVESNRRVSEITAAQVREALE
ncbi:MAG TPA: hydroxyacid dehydrogenase [Acidimicrobiia bacterium]|nr:hydroxyacid dehydrogenase [Acidimicrobiia bacterium]